jgi:ATP-binding cassette subfamily B protein
MKLIVDAAARGASEGGREAALQEVLVLVGLAALVACAGAMARTLLAWTSEAQALSVAARTHRLLHEKASALDLADFEDARTQDLLHRAQAEAPVRPVRLWNSVVQAGQSLVALSAMAGLLASLNAVVAFLVVAAALPGAMVRARHARRVRAWQEGATPAEREARYHSSLLTSAAAVKEVRLFGLGSHFLRRFELIRARLDRERLGLIARRSAGDLAVQVLATLVIFGAYAWLAWRVIGKTLSLGDLVMYAQAIQRGQGALQGFFGALAGVHEDRLFLETFQEFLSLPRRVPDPPSTRPFPRPLSRGIAVNRVSFTYPGAAHPVLHDVSFEIRPGEPVALVGINGAGKSTLVKLLCRFYDPTEGVITLDGIDLRDLRSDDLRRGISAVFQDFVRFDLTVRENIRLGDLSIEPDGGGPVEAAARSAGASGFIDRLSASYDTVLGRRFAQGVDLSMGQWQAIALARAFFRKADIVLLDEPLSALDARAEAEWFERVRELLRGKVALIVSHRFSTVRRAGRILVLDQGRIVETGGHDDLLRAQGLYARLFEAQAQGYR